MGYDAKEARQELLDTVAEAIEDIAAALAALGEAHERLDDASAERLEDGLFRPVQAAYARAQRTHSGFASRHGLPKRRFSAAAPGLPSTGTRGFIDAATESLLDADDVLTELQDSMRPVEVGDAELRAGLADVRELVGQAQAHARDLVRTLGR